MENTNAGYKVRLDVFEGPLDLLLYLIKEEELDIYDIPITRITAQYLEYINLMETLNLEIAGEFLVMAATLMQIKSKMLLPPDPDGQETLEADPRAELVRRLLEYKAYKEAAEKLKGFEERRSGIFARFGIKPEYGEDPAAVLEDVSLFDLMSALQKVLKALPSAAYHDVNRDEFSVADKVLEIVARLTKEPVVYFSRLFQSARNRYEVITTFLALLELMRQNQVRVTQNDFFDEIQITQYTRIAERTAPNAESPANP